MAYYRKAAKTKYCKVKLTKQDANYLWEILSMHAPKSQRKMDLIKRMERYGEFMR